MARGKSKGGSAHGTPSSLTSLLAPAVSYPLPPLAVVDPQALSYAPPLKDPRVTDDRRRYHPQTLFRPAVASQRYGTRLVIGAVAGRENALNRLQFHIPNMVAICVRRKVRREVLHALDKTRRGKGGSRRRNPYSGIQC